MTNRQQVYIVESSVPMGCKALENCFGYGCDTEAYTFFSPTGTGVYTCMDAYLKDRVNQAFDAAAQNGHSNAVVIAAANFLVVEDELPGALTEFVWNSNYLRRVIYGDGPSYVTLILVGLGRTRTTVAFERRTKRIKSTIPATPPASIEAYENIARPYWDETFDLAAYSAEGCFNTFIQLELMLTKTFKPEFRLQSTTSSLSELQCDEDENSPNRKKSIVEEDEKNSPKRRKSIVEDPTTWADETPCLCADGHNEFQ